MPTTRQIVAAELSPDTTHPQLHIISPKLQNANTKKGNAGTSTKTPDIAPVVDLYAQAPSGKPSRLVMSASRNTGREVKQSQSRRSIEVPMLEKHPFTSQQFIPMGGTSSGSYVVVVADSLEDGRIDAQSIRAFLVRGDEGISYGAGLWHAPMAVITEVSLVSASIAELSLVLGAEPDQLSRWTLLLCNTRTLNRKRTASQRTWLSRSRLYFEYHASYYTSCFDRVLFRLGTLFQAGLLNLLLC